MRKKGHWAEGLAHGKVRRWAALPLSSFPGHGSLLPRQVRKGRPRCVPVCPSGYVSPAISSLFLCCPWHIWLRPIALLPVPPIPEATFQPQGLCPCYSYQKEHCSHILTLFSSQSNVTSSERSSLTSRIVPTLTPELPGFFSPQQIFVCLDPLVCWPQAPCPHMIEAQ